MSNFRPSVHPLGLSHTKFTVQHNQRSNMVQQTLINRVKDGEPDRINKHGQSTDFKYSERNTDRIKKNIDGQVRLNRTKRNVDGQSG